MKNLSKGQKTSLEPDISSNIFYIGISWDQNSCRDYDIDSSMILLSDTGKLEKEENFVFYNNSLSLCGGVELESGFNNYIKIINIDINKISPEITKIPLVLTIDEGYKRNQKFGNVKDIKVDVLDQSKQNVCFRYSIEGLSMETAIITLELYKHNDKWKINCVGNGYNLGLDKILEQYSSDKINILADNAQSHQNHQTQVISNVNSNTPTPINNINQNSSSRLNAKYVGNLIEVSLKHGQAFKAESGAMVYKDPPIDVEGSKLDGGVLGGIGRVMAGEKVFFENLKANRGDGKVQLSPKGFYTTIVELDGLVDFHMQQNSFFGASDTIQVLTSMQNPLKGILNKEGFSIQKARGVGIIIIKSNMPIKELTLKPGEEFRINNKHVVAWHSTVNYILNKTSKELIASYKSGETLVCQLIGPGKIYIQVQ